MEKRNGFLNDKLLRLQEIIMKQKSMIELEVLSFKQSQFCEKCAYLERSSVVQQSELSMKFGEESTLNPLSQGQKGTRLEQELMDKVVRLEEVGNWFSSNLVG